MVEFDSNQQEEGPTTREIVAMTPNSRWFAILNRYEGSFARWGHRTWSLALDVASQVEQDFYCYLLEKQVLEKTFDLDRGRLTPFLWRCFRRYCLRQHEAHRDPFWPRCERLDPLPESPSDDFLRDLALIRLKHLLPAMQQWLTEDERAVLTVLATGSSGRKQVGRRAIATRLGWTPHRALVALKGIRHKAVACEERHFDARLAGLVPARVADDEVAALARMLSMMEDESTASAAQDESLGGAT